MFAYFCRNIIDIFHFAECFVFCWNAEEISGSPVTSWVRLPLPLDLNTRSKLPFLHHRHHQNRNHHHNQNHHYFITNYQIWNHHDLGTKGVKCISLDPLLPATSLTLHWHKYKTKYKYKYKYKHEYKTKFKYE